MDESSNSSLGSSSGTPPTGNGVPGGGDPGFHPQQMHQQFAAAYRPGKFQSPLGLHQQRPVMISYDQHSVPQQQGSYMHHGPYQQLLHQQQQLQFQQQQQQQQQQLHQQLQMQFPQQPENLQRSMPYVQDAQKSSSSQNEAQNLKSSNVQTSNKEESSRSSTAAVKPDSSTDSGTAKETNQTPAEVEKLTKELEAQRTAHEKQVKDLEALIASLQEQKKEKEVKYLRVPSGSSTGPQKKTQEETSPKGKSTRSKSALNYCDDEDMDTGGDAGDVMDSCPSPVPSIKEEPDDDDEYEKWAVQGIKFPDEDGDTKANLKKEVGKSGPENKLPKNYTLSVTDFDFCIFCQTKGEKKMSFVTEENLEIIQNIVLNVNCESSDRLKDYVLDVDMFLNNLPQFHAKCQWKLRKQLEFERKQRLKSEETDFSLCLFCQEHRCESTYDFTKKGFDTFYNDLKNLDDVVIENVNKIFNFDRVKRILEEESIKEEFSSKKLKIHKLCKSKFTRQYRIKKTVISAALEPEVEEDNIEITPDEEIFNLLEKRKQKNEEEMLKKQRLVLPEPNEFDYKNCAICGTRKSSKGKLKIFLSENFNRTRNNANTYEHFDIVKVLEHGLECGIDIKYHSHCSTNYNYKNKNKESKGTYKCYEIAFRPIIAEIEEPMFRNGKVFKLCELKEKFLQTLREYDIEGNQDMGVFIGRIKNYYTFNKKCRVKIMPFPDYFIYSNHLRDSQVAPQIKILKEEKMEFVSDSVDKIEVTDSNIDSTNSKGKKKWRFSCAECGYKCYKNNSFQNHIKKHKLMSIEEIIVAKQVMCDICGKIFMNKVCLDNHLRIHSGVKFPCTLCDKSYYSIGKLNQHIATHGEKNFECKDCGKKFYIKPHLNKHIKTVHGSGQFLCPVCGKSFRIKERLVAHSRKHSDDRPYTCKQCGKGFKYHGNMRIHVMSHEGRKPHMCPVCSYGCYTKANLRLHMAKHEGKVQQYMYTSPDSENEKYVSEKYIPNEELSNIKSKSYFPL